MPIKRREIRESAFLLIFEKLFRQDEELDDIFMSAMEVNEITVNDDVKKLVEGVCDKQEEIDGIIGKFSNKRTVERIPKINLAILRLCLLYTSMQSFGRSQRGFYRYYANIAIAKDNHNEGNKILWT